MLGSPTTTSRPGSKGWDKQVPTWQCPVSGHHPQFSPRTELVSSHLSHMLTSLPGSSMLLSSRAHVHPSGKARPTFCLSASAGRPPCVPAGLETNKMDFQKLCQLPPPHSVAFVACPGTHCPLCVLLSS